MAMPMRPGRIVHVETDQDYARGTELHRDIEGLEAGIPASAKLARDLDLDLITFGLDDDLVNIAIGNTGVRVLR